MPSSVRPGYTRIGRRIRELRIHNSLSRNELAGKTQLTALDILRLENGLEVPEYETLQVLAEAFSVPLYRLFSRDEVPLLTPRLTPRPTLDELVVERCVRSRASSVFGVICEMVLTRIETGVHKVLLSFTGQRSGGGPH
jgi:transcriptional regulator with XRE-family HTH domain